TIKPKISNTIINIFKFQERTSLSLINFVRKSRDLQYKKVEYSGSPSSPRFNASMINTIEDHGRSYVSNIGDARDEISTGQISVTGKRGITRSIGMRFAQMKTCWKADFVHLALDQLLGAIPNLEREENP